MHTFEANRVAVGGHSARVRDALKRLGMRRCSLRLVQYQCVAADLRPDWYSLFWRWFRALWLARRAGAEFLYEDFLARVEALRAEERPHGREFFEQVARCVRESGEAIEQALLDRDDARLALELTESIREQRQLYAMVVARAAGERAAA